MNLLLLPENRCKECLKNIWQDHLKLDNIKNWNLIFWPAEIKIVTSDAGTQETQLLITVVTGKSEYVDWGTLTLQ